jgi:putative ABC transport system substrate-binding protein
MKRPIAAFAVALGAVAAMTLDSWAAAQKPPRVGVLLPTACGNPPAQRHPFEPELRRLGYVDGETIVIECRGARGDLARLPALASELVTAGVAAILAFTWPAASAAQKATATVPIVVVSAGDPARMGLVASLARPGGNVTGVSDQSAESSAKRVELLKEAHSGASKRVAVLWNAADRSMTDRFEEIAEGAKTLGVTIEPLGVQNAEELRSALAKLGESSPDALMVIADILTSGNRQKIIEVAAERRLPMIAERKRFATDGGLLSYGPSNEEMFRRAVYQLDRILKGAKPADLPVEQPTKFELVVNLKTAKALGISIPQSILFRADEVIE